jgi:hypothetical protein
MTVCVIFLLSSALTSGSEITGALITLKKKWHRQWLRPPQSKE